MITQLPADLNELISQHMNSGWYANEEEVLREALAALAQRDEEVQAIREGIADMEAGRVVSLDDFDREFRRRKNIIPHLSLANS